MIMIRYKIKLGNLIRIGNKNYFAPILSDNMNILLKIYDYL